MRLGGAWKQKGPGAPKRHKELYAFLALLALFASPIDLLTTNSRGNYGRPDSSAAGTLWSTEVAQKSPLIYWTGGIETAESLKQAGIEQIATTPDKAAEWRKAG